MASTQATQTPTETPAAAPADQAGAGGGADTQPAAGDGGGAADASDKGGDSAATEAKGDKPTLSLPDEEQGSEGDKPKGEQSQPTGELEVTLPEGAVADQAMLDSFTKLAGDKDFPGGPLNSEQASALAAWHIEQTQAAEAASLAAIKQARETQITDWQKELADDKEFGGEKLPETKANARQAFRDFGGPEAQKLADDLERFGLSEHPLLIKWAARVAAANADDRSDTGPGAEGVGSSELTLNKLAEEFYDHPDSQKLE